MPIVYPTEEIEALETLECGCAILAWNENTAFDIEYCPTHEAAPALLEAAEAYIEHLQPALYDDSGWLKHEALKQALAAARQPEEASR